VNELSIELIAIAVGSVGSIITFFTLLWKKFISPLVKLVKNHDIFIKSVEELRLLMEKELKTNGGNSIKDAIIDMRATCGRIEDRQKVIIQRTKAALHYSDAPLFETDEKGRLVWCNAHLYDFTKDIVNSIEGFDWVNLFVEEERDEVMHEFHSCLEMNRRFNKTTKLQNGKEVRLLGYPYRISEHEHGGFLISITENEA
jgi:hypothetical protein